MGASTKRHRLDRPHRKHKERSYQQTYPTTRRSRRTYYEEEPSYASHRPYLTNLPPELQLSIFETLDPVSSTCLGLTNRKFYPMHRAHHKKVGLYEGSYDHGRPLAMLLKDWAPEDLMLDWESERLVSREKYQALQAARERDGLRYREASLPVHTPRLGHSKRYSKYDDACWDDPKPRLRRQRRFEYDDRWDDPRPRLRRQRRFERHDLWYSGRRRGIYF